MLNLDENGIALIYLNILYYNDVVQGILVKRSSYVY